jgi:ComF family protein
MSFWKNWSQCKVCRRWPTATLCQDCQERHAKWVSRCPHCAQDLHQGGAGGTHQCAQPHLWTQASARVDYAFPFDGWVKRMKFAGDWTLAALMGRLMRDDPASQRLLDAADWVLPLPLSVQRLRERGYNQAAQLARHWCGRDPRLKLTWLVKTQHTPAQAQAQREQRWRQLQGSMRLTARATQHVRGRRVLLVDDVMTTGATLDVASSCVLDAGARQVDVAVFARTPAALQALNSGDHV